MKRTAVFNFLCFSLLAVLLWGCPGSNDDLAPAAPAKRSARAITALSMPERAGGNLAFTDYADTANGRIFVRVNYRYFISSGTVIEPTLIVSPGAKYSPTGPQDFAQPILYTVTAENGTTRTYWVIVTWAKGALVSVYSASNYGAYNLEGLQRGDNAVMPSANCLKFFLGQPARDGDHQLSVSLLKNGGQASFVGSYALVGNANDCQRNGGQFTERSNNGLALRVGAFSAGSVQIQSVNPNARTVSGTWTGLRLPGDGVYQYQTTNGEFHDIPIR